MTLSQLLLKPLDELEKTKVFKKIQGRIKKPKILGENPMSGNMATEVILALRSMICQGGTLSLINLLLSTVNYTLATSSVRGRSTSIRPISRHLIYDYENRRKHARFDAIAIRGHPFMT